MKKIIVIGGGAGGFELVSKLSRRLGSKGLAEIILVDRNRTHIWKPLLHEVAAGVIDKQSDGIEYAVHAARFGYQFQLGNVSSIDANSKFIELDPMVDEQGREILPARKLHYDNLVLAVGSVSNDFGTPGVSEHCFYLDSLREAERFHKALLNQLLKTSHKDVSKGWLDISIVGGGATGTELAAQLHYVGDIARSYGMPQLTAENLRINVIEAGPRILPALPERISLAAKKALSKLNISVMEGVRVASATDEGFITDEGKTIKADLMVWAAGVKAPEFVQNLDCLDKNRVGQVLVNPYLQCNTYKDIYALGDCCGVQLADGSWVPPRAQSAHQMADVVANNLVNSYKGRELKPFKYVDYGSLVHFSKYSTVGSLMGNLSNSNMFIEGRVARFVYNSLYTMHLLAVHGRLKGILTLLSKKVGRLIGPKFKLH